LLRRAAEGGCPYVKLGGLGIRPYFTIKILTIKNLTIKIRGQECPRYT